MGNYKTMVKIVIKKKRKRKLINVKTKLTNDESADAKMNKKDSVTDAARMLVHQLKSKEYDFEQTPVLLIDSISQIPDDVFEEFGSQLKGLVHKQSQSRLRGKYEIKNNFSLEEIKQF